MDECTSKLYVHDAHELLKKDQRQLCRHMGERAELASSWKCCWKWVRFPFRSQSLKSVVSVAFSCEHGDVQRMCKRSPQSLSLRAFGSFWKTSSSVLCTLASRFPLICDRLQWEEALFPGFTFSLPVWLSWRWSLWEKVGNYPRSLSFPG